MSAAKPAPTTLRVDATNRPHRDAEAQSFIDDGFLVKPGLVSPAELDELKADLLKVARGGYPCSSLKPLPDSVSDREAFEHILCIHQPHFISPVMRRFAAHPRISEVLGRITAAHLPHWNGAVKCMQTMAFVKPPGKQGQAWHQDERYIPTRDRSLIGAWIAIDDATIDNGCLWVVPGSHRHGYLFPTRAHHEPQEYDSSDQAHGFDDAQAVPVEVKAGSVVFFNGYLLHKSLRNRSQIYRRVLVSHYMNAWSLLPWGTVTTGTGPDATQESVGTFDTRGVMPICGDDPYAWKGVAPLGDDVWLRTYTK